MNRSQKRAFVSKLKARGYTQSQIDLVFSTAANYEYSNKIKPGDRVMLNQRVMVEDPNWNRKVPAYREWCMANFGKVMTAKKYKDERPDLWELEEDDSDPRWLIHSSELSLEKENPS